MPCSWCIIAVDTLAQLIRRTLPFTRGIGIGVLQRVEANEEVEEGHARQSRRWTVHLVNH
jgi:hypothetical protein